MAGRVAAIGVAALAVAVGPLSAARFRASTPAAAGGERVTARARYLMGTRLVIEIVAPAREADFEAAFAEVDRLEQVLSNWRDDSEVAWMNRIAAEREFRCSADLFDAVTGALRWAELTGGAFDPTVEPRVRRPGAGGAGGEPRAGAAGDGPIGWRHVRVDRRARSVRFDAPGVGLDFGGIGKGFALDRAVAVLRRRGVSSGLLDFGGQVQAFGPGPVGAGWPVGVAMPDDRLSSTLSIVLLNGSIATSGNGGGIDGEGGPSHIIDPEHGGPVLHDGSVTVLADDGAAADAMSTALFVMGPDRGLAWARGRGAAALFLRRLADGRIEQRATRWFPARREAVAEGGRSGESGGGASRSAGPGIPIGGTQR